MRQSTAAATATAAAAAAAAPTSIRCRTKGAGIRQVHTLLHALIKNNNNKGPFSNPIVIPPSDCERDPVGSAARLIAHLTPYIDAASIMSTIRKSSSAAPAARPMDGAHGRVAAGATSPAGPTGLRIGRANPPATPRRRLAVSRPGKAMNAAAAMATLSTGRAPHHATTNPRSHSVDSTAMAAAATLVRVQQTARAKKREKGGRAKSLLTQVLFFNTVRNNSSSARLNFRDPIVISPADRACDPVGSAAKLMAHLAP